MTAVLEKQLSRIASLEGFAHAVAAVAAGRPAMLAGIAEGIAAPVALVAAARLGRPLCLVTPDGPAAEKLFHALNAYIPVGWPGLRVWLLPAYGTGPYLGVSPHMAVMRDRVDCLHSIATSGAGLLVLSAEAAAFRVPPADELRRLGMVLGTGDESGRERLLSWLEDAGYSRESLVGARGEYAARGGIVDLFPPQAPRPLRLELDGDRIESIREFDLESQRSTAELREATALALREFSAGAAERLRGFTEAGRDRWSDRRFRADFETRREQLESRGRFAGLEFYLPLFAPGAAGVFELLNGWTVVVMEPERVREEVERVFDSLERSHEEAEAAGMATLPPSELTTGREALLGAAATCPLQLAALPASASPGREVFKVRSQPQRKLLGSIPEIVRELTAETAQKRDTLVFLDSAGEAERFAGLLSEYRLPFVRIETADGLLQAHPGVVYIARGEIEEGFRCADADLVVYAERELFGEVRRRERGRREASAAFVSDFRDLKAGDYVVHIDHGIGRFLGIDAIRTNGSTTECMAIEYQGQDKLYVPLERLDLVHRYSGGEGSIPRIDTIGGKTWARTKQRIKASMRDLAQELLNLYAVRRVQKGFALPPDDHFQRAFEDAFPFEETPDQDEALREIKGDMESDRIMDRLLCGDVGYGKTEVAMRAAFKCVMGGRQVAVLVPTTILALQHFHTFRERFKMFPIRIDMISRFRSRQEQVGILSETKQGTVDVLIGTHRLLSKDVEFANLGLLVVDEEQRFGVTHKERIKQMRRGVEVLTLTATPIPRTLHMSMTGIRDMSVINTPPQNRIAIETRVLTFSAQVIREGIERERSRGGQVYFVHNRVESIYTVAALLKRIFPNARYAIGHGQMGERELEQVMVRFMGHEYDVLVATTIIENGLDIPNVNTMFINRAHMLGLSQLYQLRGRIGRSDRPAYAYMLVPRARKLSPEARKRLFTIQEFSDLGSGFRIAAMDMEIRGAGNVLGREQHGHMMAVGFDMYMKLLEQTVREMKGEEGAMEEPAVISLTVGASVPVDYIPDTNIRIMIYKKISSARSETDLAGVETEVRDRFGAVPDAVRKLVGLQRLKLMATEMKVGHIDREGATVRMKLSKHSTVNAERLIAFLHGAPEERRFSPAGLLTFTIPPDADVLEAVRDTLIELA